MLSCVRAVPRVLVCGACQRAPTGATGALHLAMAHVRRKRNACAAKRGTGYATNSAGGRGASAAGPEIPKEAGPRRRAQRRGAGDEGGIPTRSMRPHRRTNARPYAERGIAGGAGMRRSAANAPRATAGCIGPHAERTDAKSRAPLSGRPRRQSSDCRGGRTQRGVRFSRGSTVGPMQPADSGTASRSIRKIDILCFPLITGENLSGGVLSAWMVRIAA